MTESMPKISRREANAEVRAMVQASGCPRCGQDSTSEARVCDPCRRFERESQDDTVKLFEPAPAQMPGQLAL